MHSEVWMKYMPIIRIILKRSLATEQTLNLNSSDFLLAGFTKKLGYNFIIKIKKAKVDNVIINHPLAASLAAALKGDKQLKEIFATNEFHISLNPKYVLNIKHIPHTELAETAAV